jgi:ribosomal protein S12 methylthiotransferase
VGQDTSRYGIDLYGEKTLPRLLNELSKIEGIKWIRVLYLYPEEFTDELIQTFRDNKKILHYVDLPLQHISTSVLKRMARRTSKEEILTLIEKLRKEIPDMVLRTSLIVGFPQETQQEFDELYNFIGEIKLDKVGVFTYSKEEGTSAALMKGQISQDLKEERRDLIMTKQQEISRKINENKIGRVYDVLIEGLGEEGYYGRSYEMAPEIDGLVYIEPTKDLVVGSYVQAEIVDSAEYDLYAQII